VNKLETIQKLAIALSRTKSLRALADEYGVHHSTIDDICKESEKVLTEYWTEKSERKGRPYNAPDDEVISLTAAEKEKTSLQKELALKQMRIDYLELKLKWEHERACEEQRKPNKQLKKKEKIEMIDLAAQHSEKYENISQTERLKCLDTTSASLTYMQRNIRDRLDRESCIADEDIEQAIKQIIDYPFLGGQKGSLKLQHDEKALIGSTTYQEIKTLVKPAAAKEVLKRNEQSELEKEQHNRYREKEEPFIKVNPQKKHQVWAIDFLNILLFGIYFRICVVYDIFSQSYLSLAPCIHATSVVAEQALEDACQYSGQTPETCLLSDNGTQFKCYSFEETKQRLKIQSRYIPKGQPWYNGALESGNRDLRKVVYTIAFYDACKDTKLSKTGVDCNTIYSHLQACCHKAMTAINEEIVRPKFKTTPMVVLQDQVKQKQQQRIRFVEKKQQERKQRMQQLKANAGSKRKRIEDKVAAAWQRVSKNLSTEQLFAFSEMINKRYKAIMI